MSERILLSLDLGTTVISGCLTNAAGHILATAETLNPQKKFGDDVIRRLEAALEGHAEELQSLLAAGINQLFEQLLRQSGLPAEALSAAAVAANPAISHLLVGKPADKILFPPHRSDFAAGDFFDPQSLGLNFSVSFYLFPLVSGYIGGDLVAVLLAGEQPSGPTIFLDLGTNAELALWDGRQWLVTSVAAGPAFEAGHLSSGIRYGAGAIRRVHCGPERLELDVYGGGIPLGLCGSGFFSALTAALAAGLVDPRGRLLSSVDVTSSFSRYLVATSNGPVLQIYRDAQRRLQISQEDIRAFQMAKGAVAAGIECLLQRSGLNADEIESVILAGALGTALLPSDLKGVAMIPEIMLDKVRFLPSAVLAGVSKMLLAVEGEQRVRQLAAELKPYPLSGTPAFEQSFLRSLDFS